jgi:hypothetical protein
MAVTVTRGLTHTRYCKMLAGGANLTGDTRTLSGAGYSYTEADATGWTGTMLSHPGRATLTLGSYQALYNTRAAATGPIEPGTHTTIATPEARIVTFILGIGEEPTIGAPAFSARALQLSYKADAPADDMVIINADFTQEAATGIAAKGWGQLLYNGASVSSTTTAGSLDNGASTSAGAYAFLHITTSAGAMGSNDWTITLEDSADDSSFSTIATFTADGSSATAEMQTIAGTVDRYTRAVLTKTAGTDLIAWINLVRL